MAEHEFARLTGGHVLGLGIDLVEVDRIRGIHLRQGDRFLNRVYTKGELEYCLRGKDPYPRLAVRFAAKEAVSKALATGIGGHLNWTSIEVVKGELGEPYIRLDEKGEALIEQLGGDEVLVSLTHTQGLAQAIATLIRHPAT